MANPNLKRSRKKWIDYRWLFINIKLTYFSFYGSFDGWFLVISSVWRLLKLHHYSFTTSQTNIIERINYLVIIRIRRLIDSWSAIKEPSDEFSTHSFDDLFKSLSKSNKSPIIIILNILNIPNIEIWQFIIYYDQKITKLQIKTHKTKPFKLHSTSQIVKTNWDLHNRNLNNCSQI